MNEVGRTMTRFLAQPVNLNHRIQTGYLTINTCSKCDAAFEHYRTVLVLVFLRFKLTNVAITSNINDYSIALGPVWYSLYWTMINEAIHCMKLAGSL